MAGVVAWLYFPDPRHSAVRTAGALTPLGALAAAGLYWRWRTSLAALHHTVSPAHSANKPFCDGSHARTGWTEDA